MTGSEGTKHTARMLASGTQIVGGVNPRKAGTTQTFAVRATAPSTCRCSARSPRRWPRPAPTSRWSSSRRPFTKAAVMEAIDAGMPLVVIITEGIPVADTAEFFTRRAGRGRRG